MRGLGEFAAEKSLLCYLPSSPSLSLLKTGWQEQKDVPGCRAPIICMDGFAAFPQSLSKLLAKPHIAAQV